jgi:hypothetical protein
MVQIGPPGQPRHACGVREGVAGGGQPAALVEPDRMLIAVQIDPVVEVDHRLHGDLAAGEQVVVGQHRPDLLDPGHRGDETDQGQLGQVHVQPDPGPEPSRVGVGQRGEQIRGERRRPITRTIPQDLMGVLVLEQEPEDLGGTGQPAQGDRAQLVTTGVWMPVEDRLGHPVDHGVDPDRVTGLDPGDQVAQPELVGAREGDEPAAALRLDPGGVRGRVGLDHFGLTDLPHPSRRLSGYRLGHRGVDHPHPVQRQPSRQPGDLARQPHRAGQVQDPRPYARQPVDQVQHVTQVAPHRLDGPSVLGPHPPPTVGIPTRIGGVDLGPRRHHQQVLDLHRSPPHHSQPRTVQQLVG